MTVADSIEHVQLGDYQQPNISDSFLCIARNLIEYLYGILCCKVLGWVPSVQALVETAQEV